MTMRALAAALLLVCGACGGAASSPASVSGTINGQPMDAQDALSNVVTVGTNSVGGILIVNSANSCAKFTARQQPRNAKAIVIAAGNQSSASAVSAPAATGSYTVHSGSTIGSATGNVATAAYVATDQNCVTTSSLDATAGTVTLTRVDSNGYSGNFDLTFAGSAGHLTGSFTANRCAALTTTGGATCT
jgi:hypothetical protein